MKHRAESRTFDVGQHAVKWWNHLNGKNQQGEEGHIDRQSLAQLRRCHHPFETLFVPEGCYFVQQFYSRGDVSERIATLPVILAHIKDNNEHETIAKQVSLKSGDNDRLLSEIRFRRLMKIRKNEPQKLMLQMIRLVKMCKGKANIKDMAESVYWWGDVRKRQWVMDYYGVISTSRSE